MIRTDAHHYLWELARRPHAWLDGPEMDAIRRDFTLADLAPQAEAAGIGRTVLVQVLPSLAETAEFLALAGEQDLVAGVVGWADLTGAAVPRRSPGCARDLAAHAWRASATWSRVSRTRAGPPGRAAGPARGSRRRPQVVSAAQELAAGLDQDEQTDVFGGIAARVYRLPAAGHDGPHGLRGTQTRRPKLIPAGHVAMVASGSPGLACGAHLIASSLRTAPDATGLYCISGHAA